MDDEGLKKSVIDQMMGELDDVTADSLRKPKGPVKGVEISIMVSPKSDEGMSEESGEECTDPDCDLPGHNHAEPSDSEEPSEDSDYISHLLKKMG